MARIAETADLFAPTSRCTRPRIAHLKMFDVTEGDSAEMRRQKWGLRAVDIWVTPCSNNPTGLPYDCPRCTASFLQAVNNPPEGPWAP